MPRNRRRLKKEFLEQVQVIQREQNAEQVQVWFQDEIRVGQQGTMTAQWSVCGERLTVPLQTEYEWVYLSGAVCPETGEAIGLAVPNANTEMMNLLLQELARAADEHTHIVLVWDQATWHRSNTLQVPDNITPVLLPPYSPELNPVERVWAYLRSHYLSNRIFKDYEAVLNGVCDAWNRFRSDAQRVKSVTSVSWAIA